MMLRIGIFIILPLSIFIGCGQTEIKPSIPEIGNGYVRQKVESSPYLDSAKLVQFVTEQGVNNTTAALLHSFYESRNYKFAWFTEVGIAEPTRAFWALHNNYVSNFSDTAIIYKQLHRYINELLIANPDAKISSTKRLQTELQLTVHFFAYVNNAYAGKANPAIMQWYIPRKKLNTVLLLDSFLARDGKNIPDWEPVNVFFKRLKKEMLRYAEIEKKGGWTSISLVKLKTYKLGDSSTVITQLKQRLQFGFTKNMVDTNGYYNNELLPLIKSVQKSFGLKEDGIITTSLIKQLNVSAKERIRQISINLERMRWLPEQPDGEFIAVNIPEFRLHVFESQKKLFSIDIVVGRAAHSTVIFADKIQYVVFSPYWNVPPSIVRREILPAIRKSKKYLSKNNMEQTSSAGGLPVIRQKPGGQNALGKVKFLFPNSYNIYFHDTPAKSLFGGEVRAFSHGCIRLSEPTKMASWLLRNQPEWTSQKISDAMSAPVEQWAALKHQVPVYITYFTAWVDSEGLLNFRKDIYSHDKQVAKSLL